YDEFEFWAERDLVWTVQKRLKQVIGDQHLPYSVFNDYPLAPGHLQRARPLRRANAIRHTGAEKLQGKTSAVANVVGRSWRWRFASQGEMRGAWTKSRCRR